MSSELDQTVEPSPFWSTVNPFAKDRAIGFAVGDLRGFIWAEAPF